MVIYYFYPWEREMNFRGEGIGNRKAESYKDSHFTWTYIQFCTLIVTAGFWVRYFELFPSVYLFALDWSWKNLVRNIIGPFIRKNKLLVTQAAVYIRKIICTSAAYTRCELQSSLVHGLFVINASFLSYFFCKKIPLSRRVGYVMGGWFSGSWFGGSVRDVCMSHQAGWIYYWTPI